MRTLVTGASGFVGANLARRLLEAGHQVHLLLRENCRRWRLEDILPHCRIHWGDLADREAVTGAVAAARPEAVFHLAAYGAYPSQTGFEQMVATNLLGCAALAEACLRHGVEVLVNAGSSSEYGYKTRPAKETDPLEPNSHYAITKAAAAHYCQLAARTSSLRAPTLRLYSVYGPWEEPTRLIPTLLLHCRRGTLPPLVSPATARDFLYVDDAVDALLAAARPGVRADGVYNVATGVQSTLAEIVASARALFGVAAEPAWGTLSARPWDTTVWVGDASALRAATGWQARTSLTEGLLRTMDWLRESPRMLDFYSRCIFDETHNAETD